MAVHIPLLVVRLFMVVHKHLQSAGEEYASPWVQMDVSVYTYVYVSESPDNVKASTGMSQNESDSIVHRGALQIALQRTAAMNAILSPQMSRGAVRP